MREVFEVEAASENGCTQLTLPAAPYAMLDALERLRLEPGETPRWELLKSYDAWHIYQYMDQEDGSLADLNALAQRLALLKDQEFAIIEGLAAMEPGPLGQSIPLSRLIDMAYSTDCCHLVEGVVTDAQLGRFCAENGFAPEVENLPDAAFELLDFGKIGRQFREIEGGVELRSRFWIGYGLVNGQVVKLLPDGVQVPKEAPMGLFAHNLKEFGHLAAILPSLYAEEKDNW